MYYVQEGQRRLNHDNISTLFNIQCYLAQCFIAVSGVHLVALAVTGGGSAICSSTEGTIICGSKFSRISHDGNMVEAIFIQSFTNCFNIAVHHVRRSNHISTSLAMGNGNLRQQRQGFVVIYGAAILQHAAVTMLGIFAHAHIGDDNDFRIVSFDKFAGQLYGLIHIPSTAAHCVLIRGHTKKQHGRNAEASNLVHALAKAVNGPMIVAGQGLDFMLHIGAGHYKNRINQIFDRYFSFANHSAQIFSSAGSARTINRKINGHF